MKRSVKAAACICALIMAATSVSAITAYADDSAQASVTAQADTKKPKAGNVKIGKVTAVNGSEITVALGGYTKPEKSAGTSGDTTAADNTATGKKEKSGRKQKVKSADSTEGTTDTTAADSTATGKKVRSGRKQKVMSDDSTAAAADETADSASETARTKPEGKRGGRHKNSKSGEFTENGSTLTITLTDSVSLRKGGEDVTAADISVGDILTLRYDDNGELVGIKAAGEKTAKSKPVSGTKTKGTRRNKDTAAEQAVSA